MSVLKLDQIQVRIGTNRVSHRMLIAAKNARGRRLDRSRVEFGIGEERPVKARPDRSPPNPIDLNYTRPVTSLVFSVFIERHRLPRSSSLLSFHASNRASAHCGMKCLRESRTCC